MLIPALITPLAHAFHPGHQLMINQLSLINTITMMHIFVATNSYDSFYHYQYQKIQNSRIVMPESRNNRIRDLRHPRGTPWWDNLDKIFLLDSVIFRKIVTILRSYRNSYISSIIFLICQFFNFKFWSGASNFWLTFKHI